MPKHRRHPYTRADLERWKAIAEANTPDTPTQEACEFAPQISSFTTLGGGIGVVVHVKLDNGETALLGMNPMIAKYLALNILAIGQRLGWLDKDNNFTL